MNRTPLETRLLARVRKQRGSASIPGRDRHAAARLSFAQLRLWLLDQLAPQSSEYVIPCVFRLRGNLDMAALESAFRAVAQRHEVLRTRFEDAGDEPVQVIDPTSRIVLELVDTSIGPDTEGRERKALAAIEYRAALGFDLAAEHPIRVTVVRLADDHHLLLLALHHIAADGWSMEVLTRELRVYYDDALNGGSVTLAELPVQYADYAAWQRDQLTGELLERQLDYWRAQLAGLEPLELPTDRPRPIERSVAGDRVEFAVPPQVARRLTELAASQGSSLFMASLATFQIVLSRWSGQDDVTVGSPIAGRTHADSEGLIGFFVNTLVLRTDTSGDPTFVELLGRVRETALGAFAHQDVPFERLVEELSPERDLSRNPLFQVSFAFQNFSESNWELPGMTVEPVDLTTTTAKFDLLLALAEGPDGGLHGEITYSTELLDKATVERLAAHYARVLDQVAEDAGQRIGRIHLLTETECSKILFEWNNTAALFPGNPDTIHRLFEEQVCRAPEHTALVFEGERVSYGELNARTNRLARELMARGVGPEDRVAIALPRSADMIISALAVLKAGAAYLPIDTDYPQERIAFMLSDAEAALVITVGATEWVSHGVLSLVLDDTETIGAVRGRSWRDIAQEERLSPLRAEHAAYVVYTSGSTGVPKGAINSHSAVVNMVRSVVGAFDLGSDSVFAQAASFSFDAASFEWCNALLSGAALALPSPGLLLSGENMVDFLRAYGVTHTVITPAVLGSLPGTAPAQLSSLRLLCVAGEACPPELVARWSEGRCVINAYGPTEAAVCSTMSGPLSGESHHVTIGGPLANTRIYVLDDALMPVSEGVVGELYLAGAQIARGYHGRPALTAQRFVADPYGAPGTRMYRTGDLVRWSAEGGLYFVGRADDQVKVRGFRVELGEVEAVLVRIPGAANAAVSAREDHSGVRRLVGYVVPEAGAVLDPVAVRAAVGEELPEYMVPSAVVSVDVLPLTANGKLDRAGLPAPDYAAAFSGRGPRTPREAVLCGLFAEVLGVDSVGIDDSFFELGGHSLLAVRLADRARDIPGIGIKVQDVFRAPTVSGLLATGEDHGRGALEVLLPLQARGSKPPLFCVHPAMGMSWCYAGLTRHLGPDQPVYGLQTRVLTTPQDLPSDIGEIAEDYLAEVRSVQPTGPYHFLGWSLGGLIAHEMAVRLEEQSEEVRFLGLMDSYPVVGAPNSRVSSRDVLQIMIEEVDELPFSDADRSLNHEAIIRDLRAKDSLLAALEDSDVVNLVDAVVNHSIIMRTFTPRTLNGDVEFFRAALGKSDQSPSVDRWNPWVQGQMHVHDINSQHMGMARAEAISKIGEIVSSKLDLFLVGKDRD